MKLRIVGTCLLALVFTTGCLKLTSRPEAGLREPTQPTWDETQHFFLWGIVGEKHIDVSKVCNGRKVIQTQTRRSFLNGLLSGLTFGIYAPHSARVWCGSSAAEVQPKKAKRIRS